MKTLQEITHELANAGLALSPRSVRRKLNAVGVYASSRGLRPARWPNDSAKEVLLSTGLLQPEDGVPSIRTLRRTAAAAHNGHNRRARR